MNNISADEKIDVFIIGSKGIPARYGGFETFVDRLTYYSNANRIRYHVACSMEKDSLSAPKDKLVNGARCYMIKYKANSDMKAIFYDVDSLKSAIAYSLDNHIKNPIFYILSYRIGLHIIKLKKQIKKINGYLLLNPDGNEWRRGKWPLPVKIYWRISERLMIKNSDLIVCDSKCIEEEIRYRYRGNQLKTIYISYGTDRARSLLSIYDLAASEWFERYDIKGGGYYLVVGRFVPENNFETIIKEFMMSNTNKKLLIISNNDYGKYYKKLRRKTGFQFDGRIKFADAVYDKELLKLIRENAYAYIHGHEVGGTNPSLLESLNYTDMNLILYVKYNYEAAGESALYWTKNSSGLSNLINTVDRNPMELNTLLGETAKKRVREWYSWEKAAAMYEKLFLNLSEYINLNK